MKVKFANKVFEVLYTKDVAGLTMYAVEDEPNHIDWLINVEVIDGESKELKKIEDEIEIPFGAKDSELQEETYYIPKGFHAEIEADKVVIKKGEKSAAWSDEDEHRVEDTIYYLDTAKKHYASTIELDACIDWLKSLKDRIGG